MSISAETYFTAREGPDFGNVACREDWRHFLAHLLDVAGNQDGPERKRGIKKKLQNGSMKRNSAARVNSVERPHLNVPEVNPPFLAGRQR